MSLFLAAEFITLFHIVCLCVWGRGDGAHLRKGALPFTRKKKIMTFIEYNDFIFSMFEMRQAAFVDDDLFPKPLLSKWIASMEWNLVVTVIPLMRHCTAILFQISCENEHRRCENREMPETTISRRLQRNPNQTDHRKSQNAKMRLKSHMCAHKHTRNPVNAIIIEKDHTDQ